jgi:hypothetical protein
MRHVQSDFPLERTVYPIPKVMSKLFYTTVASLWCARNVKARTYLAHSQSGRFMVGLLKSDIVWCWATWNNTIEQWTICKLELNQLVFFVVFCFNKRS